VKKKHECYYFIGANPTWKVLCLRYIGRAPATAAGPANHVVGAPLDKNRNLWLALDTGWCAQFQVMTS
jgi:hypothetical protein